MTVVTVFAVTLALSGTVHAACSLEGVYTGTWRVNSYSGPVELTVNRKWGVRYVTLRTSGNSGVLMPAEYYLRTGDASAVKFRSNYGRYALQQNNCRLTGTQYNKGKQVKIHLSRRGNPPRQNQPQIMSSQEALQYLNGKTYSGAWQWGSYSGSRDLGFTATSQCLTVQVTNRGQKTQTSRPVCATTKNGWVAFTYVRGRKTIKALVAVAASGRNVYMINYGDSDYEVLFITMQRQ